MARRNDPDALIRCEACGEDYSVTYRRCPFCGERQDSRAIRQEEDDEDDGYVFDGQAVFDAPDPDTAPAGRGGKRLASGSSAGSGNTTRTKAAGRAAPAPGRAPSSGRSDPPGPINWPRLITFLCSLVIIVSALVIVFTVVYPQLHTGSSTPAPTPSAAVSTQPSVEPSLEPSVQPSGTPSVAPSQDPGLNQLTMKGKNDLDFTLHVGESHTLVPVFDPADWEGEVSFTSSDTKYATVDAKGKVLNVNPTTSLRRVIITVSAGGKSVQCTVYCRGVDADPSAPPVTTASPSDEPATGTLVPGSKGTIVGASGGLRVRSGPGTTYSVLASLFNGNTVTIVADAGDGWYEIRFPGSNGADTKGYIMGQFISVE